MVPLTTELHDPKEKVFHNTQSPIMIAEHVRDYVPKTILKAVNISIANISYERSILTIFRTTWKPNHTWTA